MLVRFPTAPSITRPRMAGGPAGYLPLMPRAIWSGSVSFGLVSVPVKAYSAVHDHNVHFHQLQKKTGARIQYDKVSAKTGKSGRQRRHREGLRAEQGQVRRGRHRRARRPCSPARRARSRSPTSSTWPPSTRSTTSTPTGSRRTATPRIAPTGCCWRPWRRRSGRRSAPSSCATSSTSPPSAPSTAPSPCRRCASPTRSCPTRRSTASRRRGRKPAAKELELASQIIDSLAADWDPKRYHDTYTEELRDLIERKAKGEEITVDDDADEERSGKVVDLMAALQASLEGKPRRATAKRTTKKASTAKKSTKRAKATTKRRSA